jgi:predicted Zn-dependent peptidase
VSRFQLTPKIRLLVEENPGAVSAALGFWVGCGSRHEPASLHGATHFAEHMFFKGTSQHSAEELSRILEIFGGDLNAFTDREHTCFHAWVPAERTSIAFNLISEMLYGSIFDEKEYRKERHVVVQELRGYEDSADDEFGDGMLEVPWAHHALGRRIGGYSRDVRKLEREPFLKHIRDRFLAAPVVISVASPLPAEEIRAQVKSALNRARGLRFGFAIDQKARRLASTTPTMGRSLVARSVVRKFDAEQVQLGFVFPAASATSQQEVYYSALSNLLGGGASSALFREIREERGLAYTTYSQYIAYSDAGLLGLVVATDKKNLLDNAKVMGEICRRYAKGVSEAELEFVKSQLEGAIFMSYEGIHNRMDTMGRQEHLFGRQLSLADELRAIRAMTAEGLAKVAVGLARTPCVYALGPVSERDKLRLLDAWAGPRA